MTQIKYIQNARNFIFCQECRFSSVSNTSFKKGFCVFSHILYEIVRFSWQKIMPEDNDMHIFYGNALYRTKKLRLKLNLIIIASDKYKKVLLLHKRRSITYRKKRKYILPRRFYSFISFNSLVRDLWLTLYLIYSFDRRVSEYKREWGTMATSIFRLLWFIINYFSHKTSALSWDEGKMWKKYDNIYYQRIK